MPPKEVKIKNSPGFLLVKYTIICVFFVITDKLFDMQVDRI